MKKILFMLFMLFPMFVNADVCDYNELNLAKKMAGEVNYEINFNEKNETFNVTFYNVSDLLFLSYSNNLYYGNEDDEVIFKNLKQGSTMRVSINTSVSNCDSNIVYRYISIPYVNKYYGSEICEGYEHLKPCGAQYLSYQNNLSIVKNAIDNDEKVIEPDKNEKKEENSKSFIVDVISFVKNWWFKIIIMIVVSVITVSIYNVRYRKIKHGI